MFNKYFDNLVEPASPSLPSYNIQLVPTEHHERAWGSWEMTNNFEA